MIRMNERASVGSFSARRMNGSDASSSWKSTPLALASATGFPPTVANANTGPCTERIVRWVISVGGVGIDRRDRRRHRLIAHRERHAVAP